jgi:hypothetical protein
MNDMNGISVIKAKEGEPIRLPAIRYNTIQYNTIQYNTMNMNMNVNVNVYDYECMIMNR